ncbi:MAG: M28 family peptidase [Kiritimatiellae bacterium]|nr:M28 family peptidase [Kiritimatiellia bacterium]
MINAKADFFPPVFILLLGIALLIFQGCCRRHEPAPAGYFNPADFNADSAMAEIKELTAIVPRHSGSPGARRAAQHLFERLRAAGVASSLDEFAEETPAGRVVFRNVIGILPGRAAGGGSVKEWIVLGAHYDAKAGIAENFQGANDSGSGVGVLLEMARVMKQSARTPPVNFLFAFFDGEECLRRYGKNDGLHGSRRLAEQLARDGRACKVRAVIILDMVGDRDLNLTIPRNSALSLVSALFSAAEKEGARGKFALSSGEILDDHQPFLSAGMPAIDIIDFEYGSAPGLNDYWHTPEDTIDKLSVQSLATVGRTVLRLLDGLMR